MSECARDCQQLREEMYHIYLGRVGKVTQTPKSTGEMWRSVVAGRAGDPFIIKGLAERLYGEHWLEKLLLRQNVVKGGGDFIADISDLCISGSINYYFRTFGRSDLHQNNADPKHNNYVGWQKILYSG